MQRATLRLDVVGRDFPVIAEAAGRGVARIADDTSVPQREAATARWIMQTRRVLVQEDVTAAEVPPPPALVAKYGVKAQMLAPVVGGDDVIGWISVHADRARSWSDLDVAAIEAAAHEVSVAVAPPADPVDTRASAS